MSARTLYSIVFAMFCAAMLGLAAGAVWMLPTVFLRHPQPWLALPVGWLLAMAIRYWIRPGNARSAALLAAAATLLAAAYVSALIAAARISGSLGIGLVDSLRTAGPNMLLQLARLALTPADAVWFIAGAVLAAIVAARKSHPA
jgi:vitamin B12 transport system permease protein